MNLLKRLFSLGGKKNKKKRAQIVHNVPLPEHDLSGLQANDDLEHEAAVGRLLRSSSARYVETPEPDYATLSPLPHPINKVIQTPASSTVSLASTSLSQRGTYNVTIHKRKRHASTEFPHANRDLDDQQTRVSPFPVEDSRVIRLRLDPSVASLIDLYDEHGKLSSNAFSNSPPSSPVKVKEERVQCRRNGSTLRQLLGAPTSSLNSRHGNDSGSEGGDISWAERFLAETESASSASSIGLHMPNTPRGECEHERDISFITEGDLSGNAPENPAISSMEVELSMSTDISQDLEHLSKNSPYMNNNPSTPQRASQVFRFLTRGKQSKPVEEIERSLPELPSAFSSPTDENFSRDKFESHFSDNSSDFTFAASRTSTIPASLYDDISPIPRARSSLSTHVPFSLDRPASQELRSAFSDDSHDLHVPANIDAPGAENPFNDASAPKQNDIKIIMNGPTRVIVTAPTPSANHDASSRVLRGPRSLPRRSSSGVKRRRSALVELANSTSSSKMDPFTAAPSRRRTQTHQHHRISSQNSSVSVSRKNWDGPSDYISKPTKLISTAPQQKENQLSLSVRQEIPATPLRSNTTGSRSLFRSVVHQGMSQPPAGTTPSPASSSEMSPVGRQIMMDVRQQRLKAREADREKAGKRFGNERNGLRV